jgi:hypothetical protein
MVRLLFRSSRYVHISVLELLSQFAFRLPSILGFLTNMGSILILRYLSLKPDLIPNPSHLPRSSFTSLRVGTLPVLCAIRGNLCPIIRVFRPYLLHSISLTIRAPSLTLESSTCPSWVLSELSTGGLVTTLSPLSSLPSKHPKATTLGCGLDLVSPNVA